MNYNELVQEAENKISNKEYELAAQMFHDIAAQTEIYIVQRKPWICICCWRKQI